MMVFQTYRLVLVLIILGNRLQTLNSESFFQYVFWTTIRSTRYLSNSLYILLFMGALC